MPKGGFYFDSIVRQEPIDDSKLRVEDNLEEFTHVRDEDLDELRRTVQTLYETTPYALVGSFGGTSFGNIAFVPGPSLRHPKGIRDIAEWYMSTVTRREFVREVFERQCEIALANLELVRQAVGDRIAVFYSTGTDFGAQNAPFISPDAYRDLFQPYHKRVNGWVHRNTRWKCFMHTCGAVEPLMNDFISAKFDILNPLQTSAAGMNPATLKAKYGDKLVFWGGLVDTQRTLPFGTVDEVGSMARERLRVLGRGGGFVANCVHNIQAGCPVENVLEMFRAAREG
jgi:uroporphyrinogen-III decarboxylase